MALRPLAAAFLILGASLVSGCFGGEDGSPAGSSGTDASTGSSTPPTVPPPGVPISPQVNLTNYTRTITPSSPYVNASWNVTLGAEGVNLTARMTVLAWASRSVSSPVGPSSYGNESGRREEVAVPGAFNVSFQPQNLTSTTVYFRAFAEVNGTVYWSEEGSATLDMKPPGTGGPPSPNQTFEVAIGGRVPGVAADYDPIYLQIKAGDSVRFLNKDTISHTATDRQGTWSTGAIGGGANSTLQFKAEGRYAYHCTIHVGMVGAVLEVVRR